MRSRRKTASVLLAASLAIIASLACGAEASQGGVVAFNNNCRTCHSYRPGDNRQGPSLHGVVGRKAGSAPGFGYSQSLAHSGIVWDEATLERFIANPEQVVPGNAMKPYGGVPDPNVRKAIVQFLASQGGAQP